MNFKRKINSFARLVSDSLSHSMPRLAHLQVTERCNCRCLMCSIPDDSSQDPPLEKIKEIIIRLKELGIDNINLWGGEPYLRDDIINIIEFVKNNGMGCSVITNGIYTNSETIKKSVQLLDKIVISIDSANEDIHDKIRQKKGMLSMALRTLDEISRFRSSSESPQIIIDCTLQKLNINSIDGMLELAKKYNVDVSLDPVQMNGLGNKADEKLLDIDPIKIKQTIKSLKKGKYNNLNSSKSLDLIQDYLLKKPIDLMCVSPYTDLMVSPQGDISFCWGPEKRMGSIFEEDFKKTWNSPRYYLLRKKVVQGKLDQCKSCGFSHVRSLGIDYFIVSTLLRLRSKFIEPRKINFKKSKRENQA